MGKGDGARGGKDGKGRFLYFSNCTKVGFWFSPALGQKCTPRNPLQMIYKENACTFFNFKKVTNKISPTPSLSAL